MTALRLVLFDIDGTLLLSQGLGRAAKARTMIEIFGTDAGVEAHPFGGKTDWLILNELLSPLGWTHEAIGARMSAYGQRFAANMTLMAAEFDTLTLPGAIETVEALRQRADVLLGLVTGNTRQTAPVKLRRAGFDPALFRVGAYGSESHNRNELAALALQRAEALSGQAIPPQRVYVVGDTVADVECARAIGAVAVAVLTGFEARDRLLASQPDYLLNDLREWERVGM